MVVAMDLAVPVATLVVAELVDAGGADFWGGSEGRWAGWLQITARL